MVLAQQKPWPGRAGLWGAGDQHPMVSRWGRDQEPHVGLKWGPGPWAGWGEALAGGRDQ